MLSGALRLDFGPGGRSSVDAHVGEFAHVPPHLVHRESNPTEEVATAVIVRAGAGAPTVNVDGPDVG